MNKTIIIVSLFVILSSALNLEQVNGQLKQIETTKFGKNLLDMIQLQLTTSDGVDVLVNELQNLDSDLVKEQNEDESEIKRLSGECEDDVIRLTQEIKDAEVRSSELQAEIEAKTPVRDQKSIQLDENQQLKKGYQQDLLALDESKENLDKQWANIQDDHQKAAYTIQRAKDVIVGEFQKGQSFLQNRNINFVQLSKHFSESAKRDVYQKKSWNKIFKVLAQITSSAPVQADSGAISKIVELCDELLTKLEESLLSEKQAYNHSVAVYNEQRGNLEEHLSETESKINNLTAEIHALKSRIETCTSDKNLSDKRAEEKTQELQKRVVYCDDQAQQYQRRSDARTEQLSIVRQVVDIINSQMRVLKKYVGERNE